MIVVYKVDRIARNRIEDGVMLAEIHASGANLVSVTENIETTPAGRLMRGVLAPRLPPEMTGYSGPKRRSSSSF